MKKISKYIILAIPILLVIAIAVMFFLKYPTAEKQRKYSENITSGNTYLEQKEYAKALSSFNSAAELVNTRFEAFEGISKILIAKNQLGQLNDLILKSASGLQSVDLAKLYAYLASGYLEINNFEAAKPLYEKSLTLDSNLETAKYGLAKTILSLGNLDGIDKYLDLSKESQLYEQQYILKLFSKGVDMAKIKEVVAENVTSVDPQRKIILDEYKKISAIDPKEDLYISALVSRQLINNGYDRMVISILEPMKDKLMEYSDGVYLLSVAYFNNEEYEKSLALLSDYSNPISDPDIYLLQARIYKINKDDTLTSKNYELAIEKAGDKGEDIYKEYVNHLLDQGLYNKAKGMLDTYSKKNKDAWIDIDYIRMYYLQKNNAKADFYFDKLNKSTTLTDLEKKEYLYWGISQMIETQKFSDGIIALAKLKELDKTNPEYYLLAGKLHLQTANVSEAKSELEQAIDYDIAGEVTESAKKLLSRVD